MELLKDLKWRYAVKKFDATQTVSEDKLQAILEAGNLAATSLGMQAYRFVVVKDKAMIAKLAECSWGEQLKGASHVIVLAACTNIDENFVTDYIDFSKKVRNTDAEKLEMFKNMIVGYLNQLDEQNQKDEWAARQVYIVLGTLLAACANARVDSCPMEGIDKAQYDKVLDLPSKNLTTIVSLPIGYRAAEDHHQNQAKLRRDLKDMVIEF